MRIKETIFNMARLAMVEASTAGGNLAGAAIHRASTLESVLAEGDDLSFAIEQFELALGEKDLATAANWQLVACCIHLNCDNVPEALRALAQVCDCAAGQMQLAEDMAE